MFTCDKRRGRIARVAVRRALKRNLRDKPEEMAPAVVTDAEGRPVARIFIDPVTGERQRRAWRG
jgi:hypothetical protein